MLGTSCLMSELAEFSSATGESALPIVLTTRSLEEDVGKLGPVSGFSMLDSIESEKEIRASFDGEASIRIECEIEGQSDKSELSGFKIGIEGRVWCVESATSGDLGEKVVSERRGRGAGGVGLGKLDCIGVDVVRGKRGS